MTDKQIATYCDDVKQTALKQFYKIQNQRKEISNLHKKCVRQQAEIERLKQNLEEAHIDIREHIAEIERLQTENNQFADIGKMYSEIKAEAIKEFAERFLKIVHDNHYLLVDFINSKDYGMFTIGIEQAVDETKKEMVGEE